MIRISGLHLLLTYQCTYECDHCFVWGSPWQSGVFTVERLEPAVFVHFGSSAEYWRMAAGDPSLASLCGWERQAAAYAADAACDKSWVLINAAVEAPCTPGPAPLQVHRLESVGHKRHQRLARVDQEHRRHHEQVQPEEPRPGHRHQ